MMPGTIAHSMPAQAASALCTMSSFLCRSSSARPMLPECSMDARGDFLPCYRICGWQKLENAESAPDFQQCVISRLMLGQDCESRGRSALIGKRYKSKLRCLRREMAGKSRGTASRCCTARLTNGEDVDIDQERAVGFQRGDYISTSESNELTLPCAIQVWDVPDAQGCKLQLHRIRLRANKRGLDWIGGAIKDKPRNLASYLARRKLARMSFRCYEAFLADPNPRF